MSEQQVRVLWVGGARNPRKDGKRILETRLGAKVVFDNDLELRGPAILREVITGRYDFVVIDGVIRLYDLSIVVEAMPGAVFKPSRNSTDRSFVKFVVYGEELVVTDFE